jgi:hypothetical protein
MLTGESENRGSADIDARMWILKRSDVWDKMMFLNKDPEWIWALHLVWFNLEMNPAAQIRTELNER